MNNKLFIPKTIRVGFVKRTDTFAGKLGYVMYYDEKGKLRQEVSCDGWRDKNIDCIDYENTPRNNYVLNKGVERCGHHFGSGRSVARVYDPREFEFEISINNLMGILMHSDVSKRDIVEECVFAYSGKDLVLLPVNSEEYKQSVEYTNKQSKKVSARDLVKGHTYKQKKHDDELVYIGYYPWYDTEGYPIKSTELKGKKHIFYDTKSKDYVKPTVGTLAECVSDEIHNDYPCLVDGWVKYINSGEITGFEFCDYDVDNMPVGHQWWSTTYSLYHPDGYTLEFKINKNTNSEDIYVNHTSRASYDDGISVYDMDYSGFIPATITKPPQNDYYGRYVPSQITGNNPTELSRVLQRMYSTEDKQYLLTRYEMGYKSFLEMVGNLGYKVLKQTRDDGVKFEVY